jgi:hypothetical protein
VIDLRRTIRPTRVVNASADKHLHYTIPWT